MAWSSWSYAQAAPEEADVETSYAWKTLVSDGVAASFFATALAIDVASDDATGAEAALFAVSGLVFVFGTPSVHVAHENSVRALASLGLRVLVPLGAGAFGHLFDDTCYSGPGDPDPDVRVCSYRGAVLGGVMGAIGVVAFDALVLAQVEDQHRLPRQARAFAVRPVVSVLPTGHTAWSVGLGGGLLLGVEGKY